MVPMIKVVAVRKGTYQDKTYFPGDVFEVEEKKFADVNDVDAHQATFGWMQRFDEGKFKTIRDKRNAADKKNVDEENRQRQKAEEDRPLSSSEIDSYMRVEAQQKRDAKLTPVVVQSNMLPKLKIDQKAVADAEAHEADVSRQYNAEASISRKAQLAEDLKKAQADTKAARETLAKQENLTKGE